MNLHIFNFNGCMSFRVLVLVALIATVVQISLGGIVRVTESGLGCPDWPLCHGRILPMMNTATLIEFSHRVSATIVGALVLIATAIGWKFYRYDRRVTFGITTALIVVLAAAVLGGITVKTDLNPWSVTLHLVLAEVLIVLLIVVSVFTKKPNIGSANFGVGSNAGTYTLLISAFLGTFALILSGSYMVGLGYGSACETWPLCRGSLIPIGHVYLINMIHRYLSVIVSILVFLSAAKVSIRQGATPEIKIAAAVVAFTLLVQLIIGASIVWTGFSAQLKVIHLSMATLTLATLTYLISLHFLGQQVRDTTNLDSFTLSTSKMKVTQ